MATKGEVVFDLFEMEPHSDKHKRAITWVQVDGQDVQLTLDVPVGHPETDAYQKALDELAMEISSGKVREYGVKGWVVEYSGKQAEIGDCDAGYPAGVAADRPDLAAVVRSLRELKSIRVPHVPWPRVI